MPKKKKRAPFMNVNQAKQLEKIGILERRAKPTPTPKPRPKSRKGKK